MTQSRVKKMFSWFEFLTDVDVECNTTITFKYFLMLVYFYLIEKDEKIAHNNPSSVIASLIGDFECLIPNCFICKSIS